MIASGGERRHLRDGTAEERHLSIGEPDQPDLAEWYPLLATVGELHDEIVHVTTDDWTDPPTDHPPYVLPALRIHDHCATAEDVSEAVDLRDPIFGPQVADVALHEARLEAGGPSSERR